MQLENLLSQLNKGYEALIDSFLEFESNPSKFNEFAGTEMAYDNHYKANDKIENESAFIYLKFKCRELINRINTTTLLFEAGYLNSNNNSEVIEDYHDFIGSERDEIISLELELERRLQNKRGIINNPIQKKKNKPGAKSKGFCKTDVTERSKLFYYLTETETIPGLKQNYSEIARIQQAITGDGTDSRKLMSSDTKLDAQQKENLITQLEAVIKAIKED